MKTRMDIEKPTERVPIKKGFFTHPFSSLNQIRLKGSRCLSCNEYFLGEVSICENCLSENLELTALSTKGKLWTYTIIENRPPGDYKGPEEFEPFAIGLVELFEGLRILTPIEGCKRDELKIGLELELKIEPLFVNEKNQEVLAYKFVAV